MLLKYSEGLCLPERFYEALGLSEVLTEVLMVPSVFHSCPEALLFQTLRIFSPSGEAENEKQDLFSNPANF